VDLPYKLPRPRLSAEDKSSLSPLQKKRLQYKPEIPDLLKDLQAVCFQKVPAPKKTALPLKKLFPNICDINEFRLIKGKGLKRKGKIGVVFSGGPAPGGHNVIAGLFDSKAKIIGFLDGPSGILENRYKVIEDVSLYRNQGGFDLIGTGRAKIETKEQLEAALQTVLFHQLDGLVIIGGDDSNTNAAILAEHFLQAGSTASVIGVPKTIDGDLRSKDIELSFGFDSATRTYAEMIGNIALDAKSSGKYYHFIKVMGRSASHIALECALKTHPNLTLISEEKKSFATIIDEIVRLIFRRFKAGKQHGVILIPEGLIEFVPEKNTLLKDLPIQKDPHGNIELSKMETEKWILARVAEGLKEKQYPGTFHALTHSFGYEGRACLPSNFDANYCYTLGLLASLAVKERLTGVICSVQKLALPAARWEMKMVPIAKLMRLETRLGAKKPVIQKTLVDIKGKSFLHFSTLRKAWEIEDQYQVPGPMQFCEGTFSEDSVPLVLRQ